MKKTILMLIAGLALAACQQEETLSTDAPEVALETFGARYIVPLSSGRLSGEKEIMDSALTASTNLAEFRPVMLQIAKDALEGKINTYPDGGEDSQKNPKTFLKRHAESMSTQNMAFHVDDLVVSLEVFYKGAALSNGARLFPEYMDLTWVDPVNIYPDRHMARVFMRDLKGYSVKQGIRQVSVPEYLASRQYEHYCVFVEAPLDTFGIRTFLEAREIGALIDKGDIYSLKGKRNQ